MSIPYSVCENMLYHLCVYICVYVPGEPFRVRLMVPGSFVKTLLHTEDLFHDVAVSIV